MSLESFIGLDSSEPMSESAFEALKERMKAAQAQIVAIKKEEKKQKKKEIELIHILSTFIQSSHKKELVLLITRVLEKNIPANFVLSIVLLGNEDIQQQIGKYLMLNSPEAENDQALVFFREDETLPLKAKIEMDNWLKTLLLQANESPQKILKTAYHFERIKIQKENAIFANEFDYEEKKEIQPPLIDIIAFVASDFLKRFDIHEDIEKSKQFAEFILKGILKKTQENLDDRKLLN